MILSDWLLSGSVIIAGSYHIKGWSRWLDNQKYNIVVASIELEKDNWPYARGEMPYYIGRIHDTEFQKENLPHNPRFSFIINNDDLEIVKLKLDIKLYQMGYSYSKIGS